MRRTRLDIVVGRIFMMSLEANSIKAEKNLEILIIIEAVSKPPILWLEFFVEKKEK
jgi:hypothetical protein